MKTISEQEFDDRIQRLKCQQIRAGYIFMALNKKENKMRENEEIDKTLVIAKLIKKLTFDELFEITDWFSNWTLGGNFTIEEIDKWREDDSRRLIDPTEFAYNLTGWAENIICEYATEEGTKD